MTALLVWICCAALCLGSFIVIVLTNWLPVGGDRAQSVVLYRSWDAQKWQKQSPQNNIYIDFEMRTQRRAGWVIAIQYVPDGFGGGYMKYWLLGLGGMDSVKQAHRALDLQVCNSSHISMNTSTECVSKLEPVKLMWKFTGYWLHGHGTLCIQLVWLLHTTCIPHKSQVPKSLCFCHLQAQHIQFVDSFSMQNIWRLDSYNLYSHDLLIFC